MVTEKEVVSAAVPPKIKTATIKAIDKGLAISESDYLRKALIEKLEKDGLL
jgi:hypothetical protein